MIRSLLAFLALGLLALFGYFFVTTGTGTGSERARQAAVRVGDTVVDESLAGVVRARLAATYGFDGARFLHIHNDNGKILIYGLLPPGARPDDLVAAARSVPGVAAVDVQVLERPAYLNRPTQADTPPLEKPPGGK
jgi:hypothetical protein